MGEKSRKFSVSSVVGQPSNFGICCQHSKYVAQPAGSQKIGEKSPRSGSKLGYNATAASAAGERTVVEDRASAR